MLYLQTGTNNNNLTKVSTTKPLIKYILDYTPQTSNGKDENGNKQFKETKAKYIISGTLKNGVTTRSNENLLTRDALILDIDHLTRHDVSTMYNNLSKHFNNIEWLAYPSINSNLNWVNRQTHIYENKGYGYRLIFTVDRSFKENERKSLITNVCKKIGVKDDPRAEQWSQVMGLPVKNIHTKNMDNFLKYHEGQPLKVDNYITSSIPIKTPTTVATNGNDNIYPIDDADAISLLETWSKRHHDYLNDESNFSNILIGLIGYYQREEISYNVLTQAMTILAVGNDEWANDNMRKLKAHFNYSANDPDKSFSEFFSSSTIDKFKSVKMTTKLLISKMKHTHDEWLEKINEQIRLEHPKAQAKSTLSQSAIANLIRMYVPIFKTTSRSDALLCVYNFDNGIYDANDQYIAKLVDKLEENYNEKQTKEVRRKLLLRSQVMTLETRPTLISVNNGIYDQVKKELHPHDPSYRFITKDITNFNKHAKEPKYQLSDGGYWTPSNFIKDLSCTDRQIETLLYQIIADSANGNFSREQAVFLLGNQTGGLSNNGSNGKSTFQDLIQGIVGDENTANLKVDEMKKQFSMELLIGTTVNIGDDLQSNVYIDNSSNFNSAVTGDMIYTDRKYKTPVSFRYTGTIIQSTNELPKFHNKTGGTYRRMIIVPFNAHFAPSKDGKNIKGLFIKTKETREWLLKKALEMPFFTEYTQPDASKNLMDEFKLENDTVRQFFNEIMMYLPIARIASKPLYREYRNWCNENGDNRPLKKANFITQIKGILNEQQNKITTISMQAFADIAKSKDNRNDLIVQSLPLMQCQYTYKKATSLARYSTYSSSYSDTTIYYANNGQDRCFIFPTRELLIDTLSLHDSLPNRDSPEYDKINRRISDNQKRLIK